MKMRCYTATGPWQVRGNQYGLFSG